MSGSARSKFLMKGGTESVSTPSAPILMWRNTEADVTTGRMKNGSEAVRSTNQNRPWQ